ncbi:carbohydrate-binding protein [Marinigracilibium pacificum]|uniref:Carbohydrate-binding protein n=1 Tax=Marinigracilibium pacificum TaxID=2729599 RepID=A0A848IZJ8_9BACT|nr:carbohydrate-binding domain-containing protein [Marinigracilibium pacificum]NMM47720.1 carbohydrate-binding protein [Marinigracilibium pacificum]
MKTKTLRSGRIGLIMAFILLHLTTNAQTLLWSDEFNGNQLDESLWTYAIGDGCDQAICGWGNQELQTYTDNNTSIENGRLVITARRENVNGKEFTSARLFTKDKVSVKYGRVEASIKLPDMNNGLWPAFWMLGDGNRWPFTGEIDIMEAGFNATSTNTNIIAKANVFWRAEDAGVTGNLQYGNEDAFKYDAIAEAGKQLNDDFFVYRIDWTPTQLTAYVLETDSNGNPIESSAYEVFSFGNETTFESEFFSGDNFYILLNMAVGGWLPFSAAENTPANVSALPNYGSEARMLIDYVRVYEINGYGEVTLGNVEEELLSADGFGIFSDQITTANQLNFGVDAEIFLWEDPAGPSIQLDSVASPFGNQAFEVTFPANQYGGMTFNSSDILNINNYTNGSLRFKMKTSSQEPFNISIESNNGSSGVPFNRGEEKYGLIRDGQWHDVAIPLELLVTNFRGVQAPFTIGNIENNNPSVASTFLIDEIYYSSQPVSGFEKYLPPLGNYGLYAFSPVADELTLDTEGDLYVWEQTLIEGPSETYIGQEALSYVNNNRGWFGLGFTAEQIHDMSAFENGNLRFAMKTSSNETLNLSINIGLAVGTIVFEAGNDPYGFERDGQWHELSIPISDFEGLNVSGVKTLFSINGSGNISDLALADIYFEYIEEVDEELASIIVSPANSTINVGETRQFSAQGFDQNGNPVDVEFQWTATGGIIDSNGKFTGSTAGEFTIMAMSNGVTGEATVIVNPVFSGINIPGRVEAENFNTNGYYDTSTGNYGGAFRVSEDVDIELTGDIDGAYNIGWTEPGEWLEYDIFSNASNYDIDLRVASNVGGGVMRVEIGGVDVTGPVSVPYTGGWQSYQTISIENVEIGEGNHKMRVYFIAAGINLNYVSFIENISSPSECIQDNINGDYSVEISEDQSNPTLTFKPSKAGVGNPVSILYYGIDPNGTYPGYGVTPNEPFQINASQGQVIYFYYTYSVPEGGERNSSGSRHSFVVGSCGWNLRMVNKESNNISLSVDEFQVFPNPVENRLNISLKNDQFNSIEILDSSGRVIRELTTDHKKVELDLSGLPQGIYILKIHGEGTPIVRKIFKK